MKNKLHTILFHLELITKLWSLSWSLSPVEVLSKCQILLFSILYTLFSNSTHAQPYQWDWTINGGGSLGETGWYYRVEQIFDVQVGSDDNYYFVGRIKNGTPQLGGQPVTVYSKPQGGNNMILPDLTILTGMVMYAMLISLKLQHLQLGKECACLPNLSGKLHRTTLVGVTGGNGQIRHTFHIPDITKKPVQ